MSATRIVSLVAAVSLLTCASRTPAAPGSYHGTVTLARGDILGPQSVVDLDVASDNLLTRFNGWDPQRAANGESAYVTRVGAGYFGDAAVVAADARGVPGAPLHVCRQYNWSSNHVCHTPKVAPDGKLVAFGMVGGGGKVCKDNYGKFWADYVVVTDRAGKEVARFEGWALPEWLPDGRLLMVGSMCHGAGIWVADQVGLPPRRIDGGQVTTPPGMPAVSPDGRRLAMVWNNQLWTMTLDARHELTQVSHFDKSVSAGAWSPDGTAFAVILFDVSLPIRAVVLFRPGDEASQVVKPLDFYPYGPLSWH